LRLDGPAIGAVLQIRQIGRVAADDEHVAHPAVAQLGTPPPRTSPPRRLGPRCDRRAAHLKQLHDHVRTRLLRAAAGELLGEVCTAQDVLGLAWARSVSAMSTVMPQLPGVPVVQLTGALSSPDGDHSTIDIVRDVARVSGGPAYVFYAPFIVPDAATAQAMRRQPEVARAFDQLPSVTRAVVGLGHWDAGRSTLYDAVTPRDREELRDLGVVTDLSGVFLSQDGEPVVTDLAERMIGVTAEQLLAIPEVIVIPYGADKAVAVLSALRSGLVGGVVTHTSLAHKLLESDG
jgi:DNA-binding transcriptional regulator LsrR (DeoR family)